MRGQIVGIDRNSFHRKHSNDVFVGSINDENNLKLEKKTFSDLFPGVNWTPGRGCIVKFDGPDNTNVTFYASSDLEEDEQGKEGMKVAVAWDGFDGGSTKAIQMELDEYRLTAGAAPLCGHAVASSNLTRIFMLARGEDLL